MIYYRKLDEVRKWGRLRYLIERLSDGKIATIKPSWVKSYGLQDVQGPLYMAASRTKEIRLDGLEWQNKKEEETL